jgi:hypothetical protein
MLRPDLKMTFRLPRDLTKADVERLAKWLATLPYEQDGEA